MERFSGNYIDSYEKKYLSDRYIRCIRKKSFKIALDKEMRTEPYWDLEPMHDYGISYWMGEEDILPFRLWGRCPSSSIVFMEKR